MKRLLNITLIIVGILVLGAAIRATFEEQAIPAMGLFIVSIVVFYIRYELLRES